MSACLDFKKNRLYIIVGLFDQDEADMKQNLDIQRMFESSVKAVNKERHGNEELLNVYLGSEVTDVETDTLFEVSLKGKAL